MCKIWQILKCFTAMFHRAQSCRSCIPSLARNVLQVQVLGLARRKTFSQLQSWLMSNHSIRFWFLYYAYPHSCCAPHIEAVAWPQEATTLNLQCSNVFWLMSNHSIKFWLLYYEYPHSCTPHTAISIHPYNWTAIFWGNRFFAISQKVLKLEG